MSDFEDDGPPRFSASTLIAGLTVGILSLAIVYNTLSATAPYSIAADGTLVPDADPITGSTRLTVDAGGQDNPATVTLRYDAIVETAQRELAASGLYSGQVDGVSGRRTKLAIVAYQRANGLDETGLSTPELIEHIRYTRQIANAANMTVIVRTPAENRPMAVDTVTRVQVGLAELGYEPGAINGKLGKQTRSAILKFERDRGISPSGDISATLIAELEKMSVGVAAGAN